MKITARTEYATLAVLELALREGASHIQAKEIAERQSIPLKFLEQILSQLRTAGVVRSVRGASGGYSLARAASKISLKDVVAAVERAREAQGDWASMSAKDRSGIIRRWGDMFWERHHRAMRAM